MLELQKIFLIVRFFNQISCNKGLKTKISCFFLCFFLFSYLRLEYSRIRKTASFLTSHRPKKYRNLHSRSFTNGVKARKILKIVNCQVFCQTFCFHFQIQMIWTAGSWMLEWAPAQCAARIFATVVVQYPWDHCNCS